MSRNFLLFAKDQPPSRCRVVFDGRIKPFRATEHGHETAISVLTRDESFAEAAIFDRARVP